MTASFPNEHSPTPLSSLWLLWKNVTLNRFLRNLIHHQKKEPTLKSLKPILTPIKRQNSSTSLPRTKISKNTKFENCRGRKSRSRISRLKCWKFPGWKMISIVNISRGRRKINWRFVWQIISFYLIIKPKNFKKSTKLLIAKQSLLFVGIRIRLNLLSETFSGRLFCGILKLNKI